MDGSGQIGSDQIASIHMRYEIAPPHLPGCGAAVLGKVFSVARQGAEGDAFWLGHHRHGGGGLVNLTCGTCHENTCVREANG